MPKRLAKAVREDGWVAFFTFLVGALVAASTIQFLRTDPPPVWDPLGEYPVQRIASTVPGVDGPAVRVGDPVKVVDVVKCNNWPTEVQVRGRFRWQSIEPGGLISGERSGTAIRPPGCDPSPAFINTPPPEVVTQMRAALLDAGAPVTWSITGEETPVDPPEGYARGDGETHAWRTENFTVVPRNYQPEVQ